MDFEIIAHRGASAEAPENTLAAVRAAWDAGADAVEVDVHITRDGQVVCLHDPDLERTGGLEARICDLTLEELREADAGSWFSPLFAREPVPLLEDVLATVPGDRRLYVEVKSPQETAPAVARVLGGAEADVCAISFDVELLAELARLAPRVPRRLVVGEKSALRGTVAEELLRLDASGVHFDHRLAGRAWVALSGVTGVAVWTVDDPERARELLGMDFCGVLGITTNDPRRMRAALASAQP